MKKGIVLRFINKNYIYMDKIKNTWKDPHPPLISSQISLILLMVSHITRTLGQGEEN